MKKGLIFFVLISLLTMSCMLFETSIKVAVTPTPVSQPTRPTLTLIPRPTEVETRQYGVGDVVELNGGLVEGIDVSFIMNSAEIKTGYDNKKVLVANFTIDNRGSEDVLLRSVIMFTAKDNEGMLLEENIVDCSSSYLDDLSPGEKVKGEICWNITSSPPFLIYFEHYFVAEPLVWLISP